jgi:hypothetical protein
VTTIYSVLSEKVMDMAGDELTVNTGDELA